VRGGGTWTLAGENLSGPSASNSIWSGGTTVILDYRNNQNAKLSLPTNFYLRGAQVEVIGAASGTTTVNLSNSKIIPGTESFANGYGFASQIRGNSTGEGTVVFQFGDQFVDANSAAAYVRFSGDATFKANSFRSGETVLHAVWVLNDQYAVLDGESGNLTGRTMSQVNAQNGLMNSGTGYYETTLAAGTTSRSAGVVGKGVRLLTDGAATWNVNGQFLQNSSVGTSLLFAGEHDVTIKATSFGGGQTHWINLSEEGALLTLDGPLNASTDHRKSGAGTILLLNSENRTVATSVQALHIGEGTLRLGYSEVMGSAPSGNSIYVQSGASVALQGDMTLQAGTTTYLHGLGDQKGGALRNHEGVNRLEGTVMLGTTSSIVSAAGELQLAGSIDALETETVAVIFDGAGVTRLSGNISANVTEGLWKQGSGTVLLEGTSFSTGRTEVRQGSFLLNNGTLFGELTVRSGAVFGGKGVLGGPTLLDDESTLQLALYGAADDYLVTSQSFTLADDVELILSLNQSALEGETFRLVSEEAGVTGTFSLVNGEAFLPGNEFTLTYDGYLYTFALSYGAGINATVTDVAAIPEPGSLALLAMAGIGLWWRMKTRRCKMAV